MNGTNGKPDPKSRADLVTSLIACAPGKDLSFKGDALFCPFCVDSDNQRHGYIKCSASGHWRYYCYRAKCSVQGDAIDFTARAAGCTVQEWFRRSAAGSAAIQTNARSEEGPPTRGGMRPPAGPNPPLYTSLSQIKSKNSQNRTLYIYNTSDGGASHGVVIDIDGTTGKKNPRQIRFIEGHGWQWKAPDVPVLYNLPKILESDEVWIVEGEKCANAVTGGGFCGTTLVGGAGTGGHNGQAWKPSVLAGKTDLSVLAGKSIYLWPDNDEVGHNHMQWLSGLLMDLKCRVYWIDPLTVGASCPKWDVVDYFSDASPASWRLLLDSVRGKAVRLGALTSFQRRMSLQMDGKWGVVKWPWDRLQESTGGLKPGTIIVWAGSEGASKSLMMLQCCLGWHRDGVNYVIFELEKRADYHEQRLLAQLSCEAGMNDSSWVASNVDKVKAAMLEHHDFMESFHGHLVTCEGLGSITVEGLGGWLESEAKLGRKVLIIDPVTAAPREGKPWISDFGLMREADRIANQYRCTIVFVTHPEKNEVKPTMHTLAGAAAFKRFVDECFILTSHPSKEAVMKGSYGTLPMSHNRTLSVEKCRDGPGQFNKIGFKFDKESLKVGEVGLIKEKGK